MLSMCISELINAQTEPIIDVEQTKEPGQEEKRASVDFPLDCPRNGAF